MELKKFSDKIQLIMDKHQLNASSFAEKIGVGRSSLSHILSGRNKPSLDFVMSVLTHFDEVTFEWFITDYDRYPDPKNPIVAQPAMRSPVQNAPSPPTPAESVSPVNKEGTPIKTSENDPRKMSNTKSEKGKNISKAILFYEDGTFESFTP
ncbi:hypothetical protein BST97_01985 [Nonlabens spongiae]|uniref:HTH cro/C1-type domain-containing protein n=1 Tax=Nonlabens spongiae TaxID=331648 RepID=A0A1W6MH13_9FLAO|nr:helix-turn-helix transcriptional regulator [Nonlabens spongiae]ARN76867.1 hypothetical protein BST97_01985 [Nonlabens spongiae]